MKKIILVLGGARSGKSSYATELAKQISSPGKRVVFLATLECKDEEMQKRIKKHQQNRPAEWQTIEDGRNVPQILLALKGHCDVVIIDCLTNFLANTLLSIYEDAEQKNIVHQKFLEDTVEQMNLDGTELVEERIKELIEALKIVDFTVVIVSNEVGSGVVPPTPLGRMFRDITGIAHQLVAQCADEVYLMTAGIPLCIKGRTKNEKLE